MSQTLPIFGGHPPPSSTDTDLLPSGTHCRSPSVHMDTEQVCRAQLHGVLLQGGRCSQPGAGERQPGPLTWSLSPRKRGSISLPHPRLLQQVRGWSYHPDTLYNWSIQNASQKPHWLVAIHFQSGISPSPFRGRNTPLQRRDPPLHDLARAAVLLCNSSPACPRPSLHRRRRFLGYMRMEPACWLQGEI